MQISHQQRLKIALQHFNGGDLRSAEAAVRTVLAEEGRNAEALHLLGLIALRVGRPETTVDLVRQAVEISPGSENLLNTLGFALHRLGRSSEAEIALREALRLNPRYAVACNNLGNTLAAQRRLAEAESAFRQAIRFDPRSVEAFNNLGLALKAQSKLETGLATFRQALELAPDDAETHSNVALLLVDMANHADAARHFRRALEIEPGHAALRSNFIYSLHLDPEATSEAIAREQSAWSRHHELPLIPAIRPHANSRDPERRLRIGYVSADFRDHAAGRNLIPLLTHHDHERCEIFCYAGNVDSDPVTERFRVSADHWRAVAHHTDDALAQAIRADCIDVLVDLSLHSASHRLLTFARKPAPLQVSFAAYPGDTGLEAIDYFLSDRFLEAGLDEPRAFPLADSFWCFDPFDLPPGAGPRAGGAITFGCFNRFGKTNASLVALWARILAAAPDSRMVILAEPGRHREIVMSTFAAAGVARARITFHDRCSRAEYLALHGGVDVILDTFPYNGHTTSLEAMWLGIPVVTLAGDTRVSRGGASLLGNLGLDELVARSPDVYVAIAAGLANDPARLAALRAELPDRMRRSPLMDAPRFARNVEAAFREMWRRWCAGA